MNKTYKYYGDDQDPIYDILEILRGLKVICPHTYVLAFWIPARNDKLNNTHLEVDYYTT